MPNVTQGFDVQAVFGVALFVLALVIIGVDAYAFSLL